MANEFTMRTVGNWSRQMEVPLSDALRVSKDLYRRSAPQACKHAVILMAQSAKVETPQSKPNRPVLREGRKRYVVVYPKDEEAPTRVYVSQTQDPNSDLFGQWDKVRRIGNRGLAKRSWMWQLKGGSKPLRGATYATPFKVGEDRVGFVKRNKLDYILKIMPAGWLERATTKATNKIMAQAGRKLGKQFQRALAKVKRAA